MLIVEIGAVWGTVLAVINPNWFGWRDRVLALADSHFRQSGRGGGRGPRKGSAETLRKIQGRYHRPPPGRLGASTPGTEEEVAALCCPRATSSSL